MESFESRVAAVDPVALDRGRYDCDFNLCAELACRGAPRSVLGSS